MTIVIPVSGMTGQYNMVIPFFRGKKILITGGCGNLGLTLSEQLMGQECAVALLDTRPPQWASGCTLPKGWSFHQIDMASPDVWQGFAHQADIIFHLAAQTSAYRANADVAADWKINVQPVIKLLETSVNKGWRPDVVFASTATVVGITDDPYKPHGHAERPSTIYDVHKLAVEKYLWHYVDQLGGRATALRLANVYGPGALTGAQDRGIVNMMVRKALAGEDIVVFGTGEYVRDYVLTFDVVAAFLSAAVHIEDVSGRPFFIGTAQGHTINELAAKIASTVGGRTGKVVAVKHQPFPDGALAIERRSFIANASDFMHKTDWQARVMLDEGIRMTMQSLSDNAAERG
ncbi:MAG: NAD-dependent epimerase/dehydratase family protein [Candidatus Omnitrophica bacterium]|nr:NAD-dependent epimerase/dehydratase family protein [Candidatus Omnitrophota bacterium]